MQNWLSHSTWEQKIIINPQNYKLLNEQKDKINTLSENIDKLYIQFEEDRETYLKYLNIIENSDISKIDSIEFIEKYNNLISVFCELLYIKLEFKKIKKIKSNDLTIKEENSKIILQNLNEYNTTIEKDIIDFDNKLSFLFNRFNLVLAEKIENNDLNLDELFSSIWKLDEQTVEILIKENNFWNNKLTPYSFIIENDEKLFELTNYLENEEKIKKEYKEYLEVDKIINDCSLELSFNDNLPEKHKELLSITLKKNFKLLFNKILWNPNLSDEEKINKIEKIFRKNIENNYLFIFREKAWEIFEEIFKYNYLWKDIFERLISKEKQNWINKNIRLKFIENYQNVDEILKYLFSPFQKKEQSDINIKLWTRSTIAILKRLDKEKNITKDIDKKRKYNNYYIYFKKVLIEKHNRYKLELEDKKAYNKNKNENNIKLIEDYLQTKNIINLQEEINNDFDEIMINRKNIDLQKEIDNNTIENIRSNDLVKMIEKWTYAYILYNMFENWKITKGKKQWKKQIASAILENNKSFTIKFLLNNDFFSEQDKEKIILEFINKWDNLIKKLEILNIISYNFNKKEILKTLISWNSSYQDFINILWNKYFKDINLELYGEDWNINNEDTEIFLNIFFKSTNEELAIQWIWMMKNYTKQLIEESIYISPNKKEYTLSKDWKIIFKLNRLL